MCTQLADLFCLLKKGPRAALPLCHMQLHLLISCPASRMRLALLLGLSMDLLFFIRKYSELIICFIELTQMQSNLKARLLQEAPTACFSPPRSLLVADQAAVRQRQRRAAAAAVPVRLSVPRPHEPGAAAAQRGGHAAARLRGRQPKDARGGTAGAEVSPKSDGFGSDGFTAAWAIYLSFDVVGSCDAQGGALDSEREPIAAFPFLSAIDGQISGTILSHIVQRAMQSYAHASKDSTRKPQRQKRPL